MLNQSQRSHFWRGRPARRRLCVQNKCTPVHTPLRGWSDSEIMEKGEGGEEEGGGRGIEGLKRKSVKKIRKGQQAHKISSDSLHLG